MSANRYQPYLVVLFEDQAYKDLFMGFRQHEKVHSRQMTEKSICRGWENVEAELTSPQSLTLKELEKYPHAHALALIDSDKKFDRIARIMEKVPTSFKERIFIMSSLDEAEHIRQALGGGLLEDIGYNLAEDCVNQDCKEWKTQPMLQHNQEMIIKLQKVFQILDK